MSAGSVKHLRIASNELACEILPDFGGKIASVRWLASGTELLQAPLGPYRSRGEHGGISMPFDQSDAGGWDECLPSVAACEFEGRRISDHGDLWGMPWRVLRAADAEVELAAHAVSLPMSFTRRVVIAGTALEAHYSVENSSSDPVSYPVSYLWSAHPLFAVDAGDVLRLPDSVRELRVEGSKRQRLGEAGTMQTWPLVQTQDGQSIDLRVVQAPSADTGDKLFAHLEREGWAEIERRSAGVRLRMEFDPAHTPYLGLWLCYGGWPERSSGPYQQCIALEPTTANCDSLAEAAHKGTARTLASGEAQSWSIRIAISAR